MGKWYVVEILEHMQKETPLLNDYRIIVTNKCPIIRLQSIEPHALRLFWSEEAGDVEYRFDVYPGRKGFWTTDYRQNGEFFLSCFTDLFISQSNIEKNRFFMSIV